LKFNNYFKIGNEIKKVFMIKSKKSNNPLEYLRVFTISLNGSLIEWCLNKLSPKVIQILFNKTMI